MEYRNIRAEELTDSLFASFHRHQVVDRCLRRENGQWVEKSAPFIDDWSREEIAWLCRCLRRTLAGGGLVFGAFDEGRLKGFVSVEGQPVGSQKQYLDLTSLHVSEDRRRQGIGTRLFEAAKAFARKKNTKKLYLSTHSAIQTQYFYAAMGCTDAKEPQKDHVESEPFDRQMEYRL